MAKKSIIAGEYIIQIADNGHVDVVRVFSNAKATMKDIARSKNFPVEEKWNTQDLGRHLVNEFGDGKTAQFNDITINKFPDGKIEIYQECKIVKKALQDIAEKLGFEYSKDWNTQTFGSKLANYLVEQKEQADKILKTPYSKHTSPQTSSGGTDIESSHSANCQNEVINHLSKFFEENDKIFFNERDLQMNLACYLKNQGFDVELEYKIATVFLQEKLGYKDKDSFSRIFPWEEDELAVDIVVHQNNVWLPIELKYKTKNVELLNHTRFGETYDKECKIIKDQAAQDLGRYGFWRDVRRLEITSAAFKNVVGGIAVFLTNDDNYVNFPASNSKKLVQYRDFAMNVSERSKGEMAWRHNENDEVFNAEENKWKDYPNFRISNSYKIEYKEFDVQNYYCWILPVPKTESLL